jgi:hypothetical protein
MNLGPLAPYSGINGQFYSLIEHFGYLIVFFGVMLGTVGIRFPSAAILLTSGVLIQQGHLGRGGTVAFGVLGAIVGNQLGYWVGHRAGRESVFKWGRYVKLTPGRPEWVEGLFARHGGKAVFAGRFFSALRVLQALVAGTGAACTGARSSSTASWTGRYGPLRSCWRGTGDYYAQGWGNTQPWSRLSPPSCPTTRGGVELLARLPVCDLPQESIGFRKPLREPRSVGPKGRYDVLRKRAAPRYPRRILLRRDTKTNDACEASQASPTGTFRRTRVPRSKGAQVAGYAPPERTEARQAGSMSAAPMRKHTAPRNVPALASGMSIRVSVLGNTKLASAEAMKATEPGMLSHEIHQGKTRKRRPQNPTPSAEIAYALATRNRTEPKTSGRQTCLSASAAVRLFTVAANVLMLKKSVPGNCVAAASQLLSRGRQAQGWAWMRVCWRCSSTPVIPGLCACSNWQYDAEVKKMEPTKNVMASADAPTARTYAGIVPRAKQDAPSMKSQAIVEFRRAGCARMLAQRLQYAKVARTRCLDLITPEIGVANRRIRSRQLMLPG